MPKEAKSNPVEQVRDNRDSSIKINVSLSHTNWERLVKMRKAKGEKFEQTLIRVFVSEGLDRAGF